jgi:Fe-S-cluster-containing dehydrogenase component
MDRRSFLHLVGLLCGSGAAAACSRDGRTRLVSALVPPDDGSVPGKATWHATTCTECPAGCGMKVRIREGAAVKAEGLANHPISRGGLCVRGQASLWRLAHPKRLRTPLVRAGGTLRAATWEEAYGTIAAALAAGGARRHAYLGGRVHGALARALAEAEGPLGLERLPAFEPFSHAALRAAYGRLLGVADLPRIDLSKADALLSVGADLLETFVDPVGFAAQWAGARLGHRWWHVEPHLSLTGANAGERLAVRPGSEPHLLAWLLARMQPVARNPLPARAAAAIPQLPIADVARATGIAANRLEALSAGLGSATAPLVVAGGVSTADGTGEAVAGLATLLNWTLGGIGKGADLARPLGWDSVGSLLDLRRLGERLERGEIGVLFVSRADPLRHAPPAWELGRKLGGASLRVGMGDLLDATLAEMDVVLPLSHALESWDELEPRPGLRAALRPAVAPFGDTRAEGEIWLELRQRRGGPPGATWQERLFADWRARHDDEALRAIARDGFAVAEPSARRVALDAGAAEAFLKELRLQAPPTGPALVVAPSIRGFDGRSRPLDLLQEVPDPLSTVSWGPWVSVSVADAARMKLADGDEVRLADGPWSVELPARVQPGLAEGVYLVQRDVLERPPGEPDPRTGEASCVRAGLQVARTGRARKLPYLSGSPSQHGRGLIPDPRHRTERTERVSLYPDHVHPDHRWAMVIDVDRCTGCGACAAACYVENNVPVVGATDHVQGREMSWLRIEPFYDEAGGVEFLPMLCQQCHYAPCEPVCPVYASYHNPEGLNVQVYNRCVGTRYCSHNCPYKVRRFNWWNHEVQAPLERLRNPDLSVRTRGMMEKCTFCVQRIRAAKDVAKDEGRRVRDGEVVPACAQSCPTSAIVFGDLADPASRVARLQGVDGSWRVFEELGTEPSVRYRRGGGEG